MYGSASGRVNSMVVPAATVVARFTPWCIRGLDRLQIHPAILRRMAVQIVFETHAITTDNEAGIATGWLPGELSEAGQATARELGLRRRDDGIAVIYVSDLGRALETAWLAFEGASIPLVVDARLRECNYGQLNGMPRQRLDEERLAHLEEPWPAGESYRDVVARTAELLDDLARSWDGARVLMIGHSANRWALDHLLLGRDLAAAIAAPFDWLPGWEYELNPTARSGGSAAPATDRSAPPTAGPTSRGPRPGRRRA